MSEQPKIFENKSERNDFGIALLVICLVFGFVFYTAFNKSFSKSDNIAISEATTPKPTFTKEVANDLTTTLLSKKENQELLDNYIQKTNRKNRRFVITSTEREIETNAQEEVRIATEEEKGIEEVVEEKSTEIITPETPTVVEDYEKTTESSDETGDISTNDATEIPTQNTTETPSSDTEEKTTDTEITTTPTETATNTPTVPTEPKPKEETIQKEKTDKKSTKPATAKSYDCLIVVGTFSSGSNARKLERQLKKAGFTVHTFFRKTNKVVSVPASCKYPIQQKKTLDKIKQQYAKDAWILRK